MEYVLTGMSMATHTVMGRPKFRVAGEGPVGGPRGAGTGGAATEGGGSGTLVSGRAKEATPRRQHPTPAHSPDHSTALAT